MVANSRISPLSFEYADADGVVTERRVVNFEVVDGYLHGFDLERGADRTFRLDRVLQWHGDSQRLVEASRVAAATRSQADHAPPMRPTPPATRRAPPLMLVFGLGTLMGAVLVFALMSNGQPAPSAAPDTVASETVHTSATTAEAPAVVPSAPVADAPPDRTRQYVLKVGAVTCGELDMLGAAKAAVSHDPDSNQTTQILSNGHCIPPGLTGGGAPQRFTVDHIESVPWRVSLDNVNWLSGTLRVAEIRATLSDIPTATFVAADDIEPVTDLSADKPQN